MNHTYLTTLSVWLMPELERMNLTGNVRFKQGGAPAHYAISVRECLTDVFRDNWIGSGSSTLAASLEWPPRSLRHLVKTSCWGIIRQDASRKRCQTTEELKEASRNGSAYIIPGTLRRIISHRT
jgi:hypothetical protein